MIDELLTDPLLVLIKEAGLAEVTDLEKVQGEHNLSGKGVSKLLQDEGILGMAEQLELIAEFLGTDVIDLSEVNFDEQLLSTVPVEAAKLYQALPVGDYGDTLQVVMADPLNPMTIDELGYQVQRQIVLRIADPVQIGKMVESLMFSKKHPP